MTNGEKYKTAQERAEAFNRFCTNTTMSCNGCVFSDMHGENYNQCRFAWLDLEAKEEKPLPCPFCGGDGIKFSIIEDASDQYMACPMVFCNRCGANFELDWHRASDLGTNVTDEQKRQLLAKWNNRVSKAVRESEGK